MFQLPTIYGKPYNHGTRYYRDKDCNRFIADDPWHRHRTNKRIILNGAYFNLIVLKCPRLEAKITENILGMFTEFIDISLALPS